MISWKKYYKSIPSQVKLGKNTYQVLWIDDFPGDNEQLGETRFDEMKQIIINTNQPIKEAVHTYWHEVLHALSYEYDSNLTEKQVLSLEKGLKDILKRGNIWKEVTDASNKKKRRNTRKVRKSRTR